jgi:hypothetical protein
VGRRKGRRLKAVRGEITVLLMWQLRTLNAGRGPGPQVIRSAPSQGSARTELTIYYYFLSVCGPLSMPSKHKPSVKANFLFADRVKGGSLRKIREKYACVHICVWVCTLLCL